MSLIAGLGSPSLRILAGLTRTEAGWLGGQVWGEWAGLPCRHRHF
jgi:hypothetical protein